MRPMTPVQDLKQIMKSDWLAPTSLDMFDAFDELDTLMNHDIDWLNKPDFMPVQPRVQQKYRVTVDCPGFVPMKNAIKCDIKNNVLTCSGREEDKDASGDFCVREFKKTYNLPENCECDKMVSFMPVEGKLVVEIPLKETPLHMNVDLLPKIVDTKEGKAVTMNFCVPQNIEPSKVHVSIKDRDLIVRADDSHKSKDKTSKIHYYKRCTLPANTDFDHLNVKWENNKLVCCAPLRTDMKKAIRNVPIEKPMQIGQ
jgi:HSP20 family molecular chaperone IbpA